MSAATQLDFPGAYTEERLRNEIGGDTRIRYVGDRADAENVYRSSDIVVMPSRGGDPFGLITIETGASRRPIATRDGGVPEVIMHGESRFLVEREDLAGLVQHTAMLAGDPALRRRIGERARQIVEERFTEKPVRDLEAAYEGLLHRA
ncbi:MAG TPA: glycosyltransferase family 4 protein [Casimicrobiaceae bacterium]